MHRQPQLSRQTHVSGTDLADHRRLQQNNARAVFPSAYWDFAAAGDRVRRALSSGGTIELGALAILALVYNVVRAGGGDDRVVAMANARNVARLEGWVFNHVELALVHWIVEWPVVAVAACYFYAVMHYLMTPVVVVLSRRHGGSLYWRGYWALVAGSGIALVIYASWPLAPPRLMPELGTIDVMQRFADSGWWGDAASAPRGLGDATNQFAAMPSLHFGWSLWCGIQMWGLGGRTWRVAAVTYPALQLLVVVATANHFLLDVLGGAACILIAYTIVALIGGAWGRRAVDLQADVSDDCCLLHDKDR